MLVESLPPESEEEETYADYAIEIPKGCSCPYTVVISDDSS